MLSQSRWSIDPPGTGDSMATRMHEGLVTLDQVAQDGMRGRASAGAASCRRKKTLQECLAEEQMQALRQELETDQAAANKRRHAAAACQVPH